MNISYMLFIKCLKWALRPMGLITLHFSFTICNYFSHCDLFNKYHNFVAYLFFHHIQICEGWIFFLVISQIDWLCKCTFSLIEIAPANTHKHTGTPQSRLGVFITEFLPPKCTTKKKKKTIIHSLIIYNDKYLQIAVFFTYNL